jgi:hypothetical protein
MDYLLIGRVMAGCKREENDYRAAGFPTRLAKVSG